MNFSEKEFKNYSVNKYKPSTIEKDIFCMKENEFVPGSNYLSINWRRFYHTLKYFDNNKPAKTEKILDVGSLPGTLPRILREVLQYDGEIYTIDLNFTDEYISYMKELGVHCVEVDIDPPFYEVANHPYPFTFPWDDNSFDFVFACEVIEHLVNPLHMLKEIKRILKPNGVLLISTDNQTDICNAFNLLIGKSINEDIKQSHIYNNSIVNRQHAHLYTKDELNFILNDLGFREIRIYLYNILHNFRNFTFFKKIKFYVRSFFCIIPIYRRRMFSICKK